MKILFVVPYYTPAYSYGGVVKATETQAEALVKKGIEVTVVTTDVLNNTDRNQIKQEIINGVNIIRFPNISNVAAKHLNFYTGNGIYKWLRKNIIQFQLIHIADIYSFLMIKPTVKLAIKYNIPFVIQPHGLLLIDYMNFNKKLLSLKKLILKSYNNFFEHSSAFISVSNQETKDLTIKFPKKTIIEIPNGIKPHSISHHNISKKEINNSKNSKMILVSLGRLHPLKGFERAINIMCKLRERSNQFEYLIYGPSEKQHDIYLQKLIDKLSANDFIKLMGPVYNEEKNNVLSNADLFVMPSISEAQGIVMLEALNCGTPAIVSNESFLPEYEDYKCCIKSDFNNFSQTAETLNRILNNPEELSQMRNDTHKLINEKFSSDIFIDKLADLYSKIINK